MLTVLIKYAIMNKDSITIEKVRRNRICQKPT